MAQRELVIFIVLVNLAIMLLVFGIILFITLYRKRKLLHEKEKAELENIHQLDILQARMDSQVQVMQFIGREIHDSVGQKLTLASLYAKQLSQHAGSSENRLNEIGMIIDESLSELRQLSKSLTEPETHHASLGELIDEEAKRINHAGICFIAVSGSGLLMSLPHAVKNSIFRIIQEFIQNSLKHAGCRRINISLEAVGNEWAITAADDGKGFDTEAVSSGIGLHNMKRRAALVNAQIHLSSKPGEGTLLKLNWKP